MVVNSLMKIMRTKLFTLSPLLWHGSPCLRLEIYGKDVGKSTCLSTLGSAYLVKMETLTREK